MSRTHPPTVVVPFAIRDRWSHQPLPQGARNDSRSPRWRSLSPIFILLCSFASSGCTRTVSLGYGREVTEIQAAAGSKGRIAVAKFADGREEGYRTNQIGRAHSAVGIPGPAVMAEQDPILWVSDGFARALASEGFSVERVESEATGGDLAVVGGTVLEAFVRTFLGGAGDVRTEVVVEQSGQRLLSTTCQAGKGLVVWVDPGVEFRNTLTGAFDEMISKCLPKIMPILESKAIR
jgi:hypothetical protein